MKENVKIYFDGNIPMLLGIPINIRVVFISKTFENQITRLTKGVYGQNMFPYQI